MEAYNALKNKHKKIEGTKSDKKKKKDEKGFDIDQYADKKENL